MHFHGGFTVALKIIFCAMAWHLFESFPETSDPTNER